MAKVKAEKETNPKKEVMSCLKCSYRVCIPKNPKDISSSERTPCCCFHYEINDKKDMTGCAFFSEFKKRGR